jgi:hypothetical protein
MSLLAQVNQPNKDSYYFALDSTPANPIVSAPAFEATGAGAAPVGSFTAKGNAVPGGIVMFSMATPAGTAQWGIGMDNVPAGGNSGNDLAIYSYADNGAFLGAPLAIDRGTGGVTVSERLTVGENLEVDGAAVVGTATTVGGGVLQLNGPAGLSRVFDPVYNRPVPGPEVLLSQYGPTGAVIGALVPYTPATTGLYTLTMEVRMDPTGYSWTNGTSLIVGFLAGSAPPFPILSDSFLACDSLANPGAGFNIPSGFLPGAYAKDVVAVVNLTAGTAYVPTISIDSVTPFNLGTTGGVRFFIQPVIA